MNGTNETDVPEPNSLKELITGLNKVFSKDHVNIDYVRELMTSYKSDSKDWDKYANYDSERYTRNLVYEGNGKFNLILVCWSPNQISTIHSHADAHCFMKTLEGTVTEELFDWPEAQTNENSGLKRLHTNIHELNQCGYICDEMGLHRMGNPSNSDKAASLHLYSPPFQEVMSFNERTGSRMNCPISFWSEFGNRKPCANKTKE